MAVLNYGEGLVLGPNRSISVDNYSKLQTKENYTANDKEQQQTTCILYLWHS